MTTFFVVLNLFYRRPTVTFIENYHFPRFQRGSNIFQGGGGPAITGGGVKLLIPSRNQYNMIFQGVGADPSPRSGSAHGKNKKSVESRSNPSVSQRLIPGIGYHSAEWFGFCARLFICALWSPAGKGLTFWLSFVVSTVSLSLSKWYPGSGVVLDCIDS